MRHGGQILVDQLKALGANRAFCVPGESYLAALDGLYESGIETIICRQEGGAAMMAEAHGKMTGEPGICFVTRGPGASNASIGVHIAMQDSTPMILFVGQVGRSMQDREAFQEVDFTKMFGPMCKWAAEIRQTERIPEYVARAWHLALSGRPGPVVLSLPEDMLSARAEAETVPKCPTPVAYPGEADLKAVHDALAGAKRPIMVIGGPQWSRDAAEQVAAFAERLSLPVIATFRYQDYMDNRLPNYVGNMGIGIDANLAKRIREADWLMVMGPRLGEMTTGGYTLVKPPVPDQRLIHIHPGAEELGRVFRTDVPVQSTLRAFAERLADIPTPNNLPWAAATAEMRKEYEAFSKPEETPGNVKMEQVVTHISNTLPENGIVTNGAGNYSAWIHRYFTYKTYRSQVSNTAGSMGYGIPAAVAAKLAAPDAPVVTLAGDGCFLMNGQEIATAMQYGLKLVILVVNNGMYGTIRMHQERDYPNRISGTTLVNPNFADYAKSFGANGVVVEKTEDFAPAFDAAMAADKTTLIELRVDQQAITPKATLDQIRGSG